MKMWIEYYRNGMIVIQTTETGKHRFLGYSKRDAETKYRQIFNLKGKHFEHYYIDMGGSPVI